MIESAQRLIKCPAMAAAPAASPASCTMPAASPQGVFCTAEFVQVPPELHASQPVAAPSAVGQMSDTMPAAQVLGTSTCYCVALSECLTKDIGAASRGSGFA